jgi:hypothetical protein
MDRQLSIVYVITSLEGGGERGCYADSLLT